MKDPPRNLGKGAERASFWRAKRVAAPCLTVVKGDGTHRVPDGRKVGGTRRVPKVWSMSLHQGIILGNDLS